MEEVEEGEDMAEVVAEAVEGDIAAEAEAEGVDQRSLPARF